MLPGFFNEKVRVDNHARNGRSSKSFIDEGLWNEVLKRIKPGDYVFIQFGHNDEKPDTNRHTEPGSTFDTNLERFVVESRERGAIPVLFNSIVRRNFVSVDSIMKSDSLNEKGNFISSAADGYILVDTHGKYIESPRNVAKKLKVPFIDLNKLTHEMVQKMGSEESKKIYMWIPEKKYSFAPKGKEDNTHLNIYGAREIASLAVKQIEKKIPDLAKYICYYDFVVSKDGSGNFFNIQDAVNAASNSGDGAEAKILVKKGIYEENVTMPPSSKKITLVYEEEK